jgi:hypothetical protein
MKYFLEISLELIFFLLELVEQLFGWPGHNNWNELNIYNLHETIILIICIIHLKWLMPFAPLRLTSDLTPVIISNGSSSRSVIGPWSLRLVSKGAPLVLLPPAVLAPVPWPKVVSIERSPSNASLAVSSASDVVKSASGRAKSATTMDYKIEASHYLGKIFKNWSTF